MKNSPNPSLAWKVAKYVLDHIAQIVGAVIAAVIAAYFLQDALFDPGRAVQSQVAFVQDFESTPDNSPLTDMVCTDGICDVQHMYPSHGALALVFPEPDVWGGILRSANAWAPGDIQSIEAKLRLGSGTMGGIWVGIDSHGWTGEMKGPGCSMSIASPSENSPHVGCNVGPDGKKLYYSMNQPVQYDTWHTIRIEFTHGTSEQRFYCDDFLIGQFTSLVLTDVSSLIVGVWREGDGPISAYVDDISVRTFR